MARLPSVTPYGVFVHFSGGGPAEHRRLLEGHGLTVTAEFNSVDVMFAVGTVGDVRALTREPSIVYLEKDRALEYYGDTGVWATRARVAQEAVAGGPYFDASGDILVGDGVGVAVVDSGIDGTHPDLQSRVKRNFKIVCTTPGLISTATEQCFGPLVFIDVGNSGTTDTTSGHGTHVSGIVAGDGTASTGPYPDPAARPNVEGTFTGVAPGAALFGYSTGEVISVLYATEAFQHILDNFNSFDPPIRVINNSYGDPAGSQYDPNSVFSKLTQQLVARDVTLMFAAGNSGGTGSADATSSFCKDPTPGVVCVANYNDAETGNRNNALNANSSRGRNGFPTTYPDVSAPGTFITSTCVREVQPVCNIGIVDEIQWAPWYATISGTSMASPHAAGVAALLLQARPNLTPAAIEDLLQDTAHKFTAGGAYQADPQNPGGTTSFDKGAGLIDVPAALDALGVDHAGSSGGSGTPAVRITDPADGSTFDGTGSIDVSGTANDGTSPSGVTPQTVVGGDGGDLAGPGAADLVGLVVEETAAGVTPGGVTYRITVRDATDFGGAPSITLRVTQNLDGRSLLTNVVTTPSGVSPGTATPASAVATSASRSGNTISFFVPYANLGNPPSGAPGHNVFISSFVGLIVDVAPSPAPGASADVLLRPMYSKPYMVVRPQIVEPPTAAVTLSVDGGPEQATTLTGTSPAYGWETTVDGTTLDNGEHTLTATLHLDGAPAATHSITIFINREPPPFEYEVLITGPRDGDIMPRAAVQVRGTTFTDDPSSDRRVTLEVTGPESDPETDAVGTSPWSLDVDFDRTAGSYTLTARYYVDGVLRATDAIGVVVPPPTGDEVSCAPRTIGFWRAQFDDHGQSQKFTDQEASVLADRAVQLSDGYFTTRNALRDALFASGNEGAVQRAARQYAGLLLNLAAGDLSRSMSHKVGLSGSETLDPTVYDTGVLGATVDSATQWIRSQLPDGNLGGANEVADAINNGHGLICG